MLDPNVVILLPAFNPNFDFFKAQIESIKNQTFNAWDCFVLFDGTDEVPQELVNLLDNRFRIFRGSRLGVYANIERGLQVALNNAKYEYFFFCDQDDIWELNKLSVQIEFLVKKDVSLIHSDMCEINQFGKTTAHSVWTKEKRSSNYSVMQLLTRNSITGCTMGVKREIIELSVPFPKQKRELSFHHDLWISLVTSFFRPGQIVGLTNLLVFYRQHGRNLVGSLDSVYQPSKLSYAVNDYRIRRRLMHELLIRQNRKDRKLIFTTLSSNALTVGFFLLGLKGALMRQPDTKLKFTLAGAGIFSVIDAVKNRLRQFLSNFQTYLLNRIKILVKRFLFKRNLLEPRKITILENFIIDMSSRKSRLLVFLPSLNNKSLFGGAATLLKLAAEISRSGIEVILFSTDESLVSNLDEVHSNILEVIGRDGIVNISIHDPSHTFEFTKNDVFIASAWWNAAGIQHLIADIKTPNIFLYLIQDFEPGFYEWSTNFARSMQTYRDVHIPIYNSRTLKDFFHKKFSTDNQHELVLNPLFLRSESRQPKSLSPKLQIVFYARPSVSRNLFQLGIEALNSFAQYLEINEVSAEFIFVGEEFQMYKIRNYDVTVLGKLSSEKYLELISESHIGLALMLSPHPSYPPLEFLDAGMWTVTNSFENKTRCSFPTEMIVSLPEANEIVSALVDAYKRVKHGLVPKVDWDRVHHDYSLSEISQEIVKKYFN